MKHPLATTAFFLGLPVLIASCGGSNETAATAPAAPVAEDTSSNSTGGGTPTGDVTAQGNAPGRLLASNCFACHGTDGRASGGFDRLAGESASEIIEEMHEMRREDEGIMTIHALGYSDEQLRLLAEYFATQ